MLMATLALLTIIAATVAIRFLRQPVNGLEQQPINDSRALNQSLLEEARMRLIVGALKNEKTPGALPCPDATETNKGSYSFCTQAEARTAARFPYADNDVPVLTNPAPAAQTPIKDSADECVWYAVSPAFLKHIDNAIRRWSATYQFPINPENFGNLTLNNQPVVAVLLAPGKPIHEQSYAQEGMPLSETERVNNIPCNTGTGSAFLERLDSANNAGKIGIFADSGAPTAINLATGLCTRKASIAKPENIGAACNNDTIVPIRRDDLMKPLILEVLTRLTAPAKWKKAGSEPEVLIPDAVPGLLSVMKESPPGTLDEIRTTDSAKPRKFDVALFGDDITNDPVHSKTNCFKSIGDGAKEDFRPLWLCANEWYKFIDSDGISLLTIWLDRKNRKGFRCSIDLADVSRTITCS